jgi:cystathionine beta-lyase
MELTAFEKNYFVDRAGSGCAKWDDMGNGRTAADGYLPFTIADMDFRVPDCVTEALHRLVEHGVYGYPASPKGFSDAFCSWQLRRHGYAVDPAWTHFIPGVVCGMEVLIQALTEPGDACLALTPSYPPFITAPILNGRRSVTCPLVEHNGCYSIDFAAFEACIVENGVKAYLHCSPHNPTGRVWTRAELEELIAICRRHNVWIFSDEIHQDIVMPGHVHLPTATLTDYGRVCTLTSLSKTFNLAGIRNAVLIVPDPDARAKALAVLDALHIELANVFGYAACEAAYNGGEAWLEDMLETVHRNFLYLRDTLTRELPGTVVTPLEGTYLAWVDLGPVAKDPAACVERAKLVFHDGDHFLPNPVGDTHFRINLATALPMLAEALDRLIAAVREEGGR